MKSPQNARKRLRSNKNKPPTKVPSGKRPNPGNKPPTTPPSRFQGCLTALGILAALITAGSIIAGGIWLGILLMVNPDAVVWLNQFLPEWTRIPIASTSPPQTLSAIQSEVRQKGLLTGEPQFLNTEVLLPLVAIRPNCQITCERIVELRVYQPVGAQGKEKTYQLVAQLPIAEPEDYFVLSDQQDASGDASLSRSLPFTQLIRFDGNAPAQGFWFNLWGQQSTGDTPMMYGQVIHYNPDQMHLSVMLPWTSPNEQPPYWQQVTDTSTPELVIDQTVGLEPQFKIYQIQPRPFVPNPIYLEELSLAQPAIDTPAYRNALLLARNGLWSLARQGLQAQKQKKWSTTAQAQLDFIHLHARVTTSQAQQVWATPSSTILAKLIDGQWTEALQVFQSTEPGTLLQEVVTLLKTDANGLWKRVDAAVRVNPDDEQAKTWGVLILATQQGREKAIAWLKQLDSPSTLVSTKQTPTPTPISQEIYDLLDHLESAFAPISPLNSYWSQIVGDAQFVGNVNPKEWNWGAPETLTSSLPTPYSLPPRQVWYQVQVVAFNDSERWQRMPFTPLPSGLQLWRHLGLGTDSQIQITVWTADGRQESTLATVKAISYRDGVLQVLATGLPLVGALQQKRLLAYTESALRWQEPGSVTLAELNKLQPQWVTAMLPILERELRKSGQWSQAMPDNAAMLQEIGHWAVRPIDLTGNNQPEGVVTVYEDLSLGTRNPDNKRSAYKTRTLIFSDTGALLYSEFSKEAGMSLTAIADLDDGGPAALLINEPTTYRLRRWSTERQRFE